MSKSLRSGSGLLLVLMLLCLTITPALAAPPAQGATIHVVSAGENLNTIANRYGTSVNAIVSANSLASANFIYVGQRLTIPGASAGSTSAGGVHTVGYGESLTSIALRYGTSVWAIAAANGLSNPNFVYAGQRLTIPGVSTTSAPATGSTGATHVVQAGQNLASIAARYGVTANAIASANGIVNANLIYVGQKLTIPAAGATQTQPQPAPASSAPTAGRWIDVNLSTQQLVAYEGSTPVYWVTVSTGLPATPTVTGTYKIYSKYPSTSMSGPGYYMPNVPWVMFFFRGYSIHGTYWHNNFGTPMSHGCVNAPTPDAEWLYNFASIGTPVVTHY